MKHIFIFFFLLSALWALGQTTEIITFKIEGMTCQGCVNTATQVLKDLNGIESVSVDLDSKQATVTVDKKITINDIRNALSAKTNFEALFAGETLPQPLTEKEKEGLDITMIEGGDKLKFEDHLAKGKITIFDFYADWCGPCRIFSPKVERLLLEEDHLALRKVDVVDWKSVLAVQLTKEFKIPALPFTLIFDDEGELLGKVEGNDIGKVKGIVNKQ